MVHRILSTHTECFVYLTENSFLTGVDFKDIEYEHLAEAIREVCKEQNLAAIDGQVRRERL